MNPDPLRAPETDDYIAGLYAPDRPSRPQTFAWILLAGLLFIAGGLALTWLWTR